MNKSRRIAYLGLLCGAATALSALEGLLPALPFLPPGAKAGFSNIITMFTASFWGLGPALGVSVVKSLFVLFTRGGMAFMMSFAGGLLSTLVMWLCIKKQGSLILTGVLGALTHNTTQLAVASLLTATPALWHYYPLLLLFAVIAGLITGCLLQVIHPPLYTLGKRIISQEK